MFSSDKSRQLFQPSVPKRGKKLLVEWRRRVTSPTRNGLDFLFSQNKVRVRTTESSLESRLESESEQRLEWGSESGSESVFESGSESGSESTKTDHSVRLESDVENSSVERGLLSNNLSVFIAQSWLFSALKSRLISDGELLKISAKKSIFFAGNLNLQTVDDLHV